MIAHPERPDHDAGGHDAGAVWEAAPAPAAADLDVAAEWSASGCQAITAAGVAVPSRLVAGVAGVVDELDRAGARVAARFGGRGLGALSERAASLLFRPSGRVSCGGGSRLLQAADGWVAVTLARATDRELLPAWLGLAPDAACVVSDADPWADVARRVARRERADLIDSAVVLGLACAAVGELRPQPAVWRQRLGDAPPADLGGLRVVNLGSLWAAPLAAHVLARLGADVVCVESTGRPDGARLTPQWFDAMHAGQRSVALDFRDAGDATALAALLTAADVVIEGSRPRALAQLGISPHQLVPRGPRVWVSITGFGRRPATAMRVALGDDAAAAGGLIGWVDDGPVFVADAVADPATGLIAAHAVVDAVASGGRWLVDVALAGVASTFAQRVGDPLVPVLPDATAPRTIVPARAPFALGAHTAEVLREWAGQHTVSGARRVPDTYVAEFGVDRDLNI